MALQILLFSPNKIYDSRNTVSTRLMLRCFLHYLSKEMRNGSTRKAFLFFFFRNPQANETDWPQAFFCRLALV